MRKICLFILFISISSLMVRGQSMIHLLGFEADDSSFGIGSYTVMYDNTNDINYEKLYIPYYTIGIVRDRDEIRFLFQNYLIVPTQKDFVYLAQEVIEIKNDTTDTEFHFEREYQISNSISEPKRFIDKKTISNFVLSQKPLFADAINIKHRKLSFVTPDFYITKGFNSQVHGGATWFNATEVSELKKLNPRFKESSNKLRDYFSNDRVNEIIIQAVDSVYGNTEEKTNEDSFIPWAGQIKNYDEVYFTFKYDIGITWIEPLVLLNGNSARSFFEIGEPFRFDGVINKFIPNEIKVNPICKTAFRSPDYNGYSTEIDVKDGWIYVYDGMTNKLLAKKEIPPFNKIIMSEWALGKNVQSWEKEFEYNSK